MRCRPAVSVVALLALSVAAPLGAQVPRPVQLGIGIGLTLLTGEDRDFFSDGFNAAGNVTVNIPAARIGLRAEVMYQALRGKDRGLGPPGGPDTLVLGDFNVVAGIASLVYHLSPPLSPARPYVLLGGGLFRTEADAVYYGTPVSGSSTDFGIAVGAGVRFRVGGVRLFAEGRLHSIFGEGESARVYPVTVGVVF